MIGRINAQTVDMHFAEVVRKSSGKLSRSLAELRLRAAPCQPACSRCRSHRRRDSCVSPDLRPTRRLSTLISSSRSGQWIPSPPPIRRRLARSAGVPCAKRGNQASGTAIVRPSASSAIRASSLTLTLWASACLCSAPEVLIPLPQQINRVFRDQILDSSNLRPAEAATLLQADPVQPKLRRSLFPLDMHVGRLIPIRRVKKYPVWPRPKNGWQRIQCTRPAGRLV
jgi:hypothetical protein